MQSESRVRHLCRGFVKPEHLEGTAGETVSL